MPDRRPSLIPIAIGLLLVPLLVVGCGGTPELDSETGRSQTEVTNLRRANEVLKKALGTIGRERDRYKDRSLAADDELRTSATMIEYFEARHRAQLQFVKETNEAAAAAAKNVSDMKTADARHERSRREAEKQLEEVTKRLSERASQNEALTERLAGMTQQRDSLLKEKNALTTRLNTNQSNTSTQLTTKDDELETLRQQVNRLKNQLAVLEKNKEEAVPTTSSTTDMEPPKPEIVTVQPAASSFLTGWWNRSVTEVQKGEFNADNMLMLGCVGGVASLGCFVLFLMFRSRRLRKRLERVAGRGTPTPVAPLRADEVSPAVAQVGQAAENLAATMQMRPLSAERRSVTQSRQQREPVPAMGGEEGIAQQLDGLFGSDGDEAATVVISPAAPQQKKQRVQSKSVAIRKESPRVNDAELLSDLQQAIQDKFKELKD